MKKLRSTRSHFTHARSCSCALNQVPTRAKQPASVRTYSLWKGDIFSFDRFAGYTKGNQNRFGRVLPFAFALTCYKIYLFFPSLSDFDSLSWHVHLSYGVCRLRARVQRKTLSSLLKLLLSSGGFGHLNGLNFNNSVYIAQLKACSRVRSWISASNLAFTTFTLVRAILL